jgi:hypothetical protein
LSESASIASLPPVVEFPPKPVSTDVVPEGLMLTALRSFDTAHNVAGPSRSTASSKSGLNPRQRPRKLPALPYSVRRGYWNRRGDHLTPDGYIVFPPPSRQYPEELRMYPSENQGYQNHTGLFIAYVSRPELPQSLPRHGKPPERPYESVCFFLLMGNVEGWSLILVRLHSQFVIYV